jgi:hypothetical protein
MTDDRRQMIAGPIPMPVLFPAGRVKKSLSSFRTGMLYGLAGQFIQWKAG